MLSFFDEKYPTVTCTEAEEAIFTVFHNFTHLFMEQHSYDVEYSYASWPRFTKVPYEAAAAVAL